MGKKKSSKNTAGLDFVINTFVEGIKDVESDLEKLRKKIESKPIMQKVSVETVDAKTAKGIAGLQKEILKNKKAEAKLSKSALARERAGRGTRRPFEAMMMGIGSFMLLKYAAQVPFLWASALGDAMANVETESRKGHAYRQSLGMRGIGTEAFDTAVSRYSELSGEQGYKSRLRMAGIYSQLEQRGYSASSLNPNALANVLQGMTLGMGMSDEQADKKLVEMLSGKLSKEDKKTFGIKSRTPVQILEEINSTLLKNPVVASTMTGKSAASDMKFIRGAKNELLSRINDLWPGLFTDITGPMKAFTKTFFGLDNDNVKAEWITTLSTIRDQVEKVFTKTNAEKLAKAVNRITSAIVMVTGTIADFMFDHPILGTLIAGIGLHNKSKTGSFFDFGGIFSKAFGKDGIMKVFVTNIPKQDRIFFKHLAKFTEIMTPMALGGILKGAIIGSMLGLIIGKAIVDGIKGHYAQEKYQSALPYFEAAGLTQAQKYNFLQRLQLGEDLDTESYIRETIGEDRYNRYKRRQNISGIKLKEAFLSTSIGNESRLGLSEQSQYDMMIHKLGILGKDKSRNIGNTTNTYYSIGTVNIEGRNIKEDRLINDIFDTR